MDVYSAFIVTHPRRSGITQFYLQTTPYLPLPRKRSPDGATINSTGKHQVAANY